MFGLRRAATGGHSILPELRCRNQSAGNGLREVRRSLEERARIKSISGHLCWLEPNWRDRIYHSLDRLHSLMLGAVGARFVQRNLRTILFQLERSTACALFVVYCGWNAYWLFQWRVPPSLFLAFTGLPCPTTGGTRSMICLLRGDWQESLRWSMLTIPSAVLFASSLWCVARCRLARHPIRLHDGFLFGWGALLAVAWVCKLLGNPNYW